MSMDKFHSPAHNPIFSNQEQFSFSSIVYDQLERQNVWLLKVIGYPNL